MSKMNDLSHLLGGHSLQEARGMLLSFWAKYRALFPQHQLWAEVESHRKTLDRCLPIFLHGDEGVTYKKGGVLVLSMQGAFGHGSRASERAKRLEENYRALSDGIPLNFLRTGFQTRLLICVCPKDMYAEDRRVWNALFENAVADLATAQREGVDLGGTAGRIFPIVLGNKGDWSYLVSSANLERSYRRAPKGAGENGDHNVEGPGVCHLCTCGQGTDWEDLNAADAAMDQAFTVELPVPWDRESPMTRELLVDNSCNGKNRFHCIDPWHALHLGIGKAWVASGIMMLQHLVPETQVDKRMRAIGAEYRSFCRRQKLDPVIRRIDIHSFGGGGANEANGTWNKAAVTSNFMMFLQEFCEQRAAMVEGDERLRIFAFGTKRINTFMRGIYSGEVFLPRATAAELSKALYEFIKAYLYEAHASAHLGLPYFPLFPKLHFLHETAHELKRQSEIADYAFNPAVYSCALDEDFIGRTAVITRCVSPRIIAKRTLERYLCHIQLAWARH
ncbi:unnamed protein product [Durusdinium trenchii]|uniref:Uncharacterized protein n=1 Tax=Durusdinium trenchii TaxID=1381693 RepID=A0ABP0II27_9DINO